MANLPFLDLEQRTGIKSSDIDDFLSKVDAVDDAIRGLKEGKLDPTTEIRIPGVMTESEKKRIEEERVKEEEHRRRLEKEKKERQKKEEHEKWWDCAELVFGSKEERAQQEKEGKVDVKKDKAKAIAARYDNNYSRWEGWEPDDPVTEEEKKRAEEEKERQDNEVFEKANAEFCNQVKEDMKARDEAKAKKEEGAELLRLRGNRFFKARQWDKALQHYMDSLRQSQFRIETITNIAQVHLRLEQYDDAIEFCDRALHVCPSHAKALSRRAQAFVKKGDLPTAMADLDKAVRIDPNNEDLRKQHDEVKQTINDAKAEEAVASVRATLQESPLPTDVDELEQMVNEGSLQSIEAMGLASIDHIMQALTSPQGPTEGESKEGKVKNGSGKGAAKEGLRLLAPLVAAAPSHAVYLRTSGALASLCTMVREDCDAILAARGENRQPEDRPERQWLVQVLAASVESDVRNRLVLLREGLLSLLCSAYLCPSTGAQAGERLVEGVLLLLQSCVGSDEVGSGVAGSVDMCKGVMHHATSLQSSDKVLEKAAALARELAVKPEGHKTLLSLDRAYRSEGKTGVVEGVAQRLDGTKSSKPARHALVGLLTALAAISDLRAGFVGPANAVLLAVCRGSVDKADTRALALGALMNAGLEDEGKVKEDLIAQGGVELTASLLGAGDALRSRLACEELWSRSAGLLSRLATRESGRARILNIQGVLPTLATTFTRVGGCGEDERGHAVRILANVMDDCNAQGLLTPALVQALVRVLPEPRRDVGGAITAETVTLTPGTKAPLNLAVSVTKCLMCIVSKEGTVQGPLLEALVKEEGVERMVCAFANAGDGPLRRNLGGALARLAKAGGPLAERIRELRFMEMMVQLGSRLLDR